MKMAFVFLSVALAAGPRNSSPPSLEASLRRLGLASALVVKSEAVDEHPVWSSDGKTLAVKVDEKWSTIDLGNLSLIKGTWHDGEGIAVADPSAPLAPISESQVRQWEKSGTYSPRNVTTKAGMVIELKEEGLGTLFRIARKGQKPTTLWTTSLESCHSLSLSPDQSLVAFVCELNGVVVTMLDP